MPLRELHVAAVDKRRRPASSRLLLPSDEQVDGESPLGMLTNILAILALLTCSVLALPLEFIRRHLDGRHTIHRGTHPLGTFDAEGQPVDAAATVDAKTAPTAAWKTPKARFPQRPQASL